MGHNDDNDENGVDLKSIQVKGWRKDMRGREEKIARVEGGKGNIVSIEEKKKIIL